MLIDLHAHSAGISTCCRGDAKAIILEAKKTGIDGIVLANHYCKLYIGDAVLSDYVERYMAEYRAAAEIAATEGIRLFFAVEVTLSRYNDLHVLLYGVSEDFLFRHPAVFDYELGELYALLRAEGAMLVQAHPHRKTKQLLDVTLLDGIEISCHPKYEGTHLAELAEIAAATGKILTCGGDYHADTPYRPLCGVYLPDTIESAAELAQYLMQAKRVQMMVQETDGSAPFAVVFERGKGLLPAKEVQG